MRSPPLSPLSWRARRALVRGWRDEDGSMVVFGLFLFVMMLIVAGMAVDIMRFESVRTRLQSTLDRSVLAAADLDQTRDADTVVRDWFDSAGLLDQLDSVEVTETINSRSVGATASLTMGTFFMDMAGVDRLEVPASGTAQEAVNDIEIILVLDVSGSMSEASGGSTKIALLRSAAREFVSTVLANDTDHRMSIAIVPFNAQVNLGPTIFNGLIASGFNITYRHGYSNSHCLDLPTSAYAQPALSTGLEMPQAGWFDGVSTTTRNHTVDVAPQAPSSGQVFCRTETQNFVRLPSQNVTTMRSQLQSLSANGNTSITMGMKWANFMLDPASQPFFTRMINGGQMPASLAGRPYAYDRDNTLKIVVVMTDGEHVSSLLLEDGYRTGPSNIWRSGTGSTAEYSAYFDRAGTNLDYWVPSVDGNSSLSGVNGTWLSSPYTGAGAATRLNWNEVWVNVRPSWVAWTLYARALCPVSTASSANTCRNNAYNLWMDNFMASTDVDDMDSTLQQSCTQAKANRVVVYGIAFEVDTQRGRDAIFNCASSPSHYFDAQGLNITNAFRAIAAQINALRLVN